MTEPVLSIQNLVVEFPFRDDVFTPVNGVSFHLMHVKDVGVVGESGAGK